MLPHKLSVKGFTLIELLVVIAIISIVAAISVPNITSWTSSRTISNELTELTKLIDYAKVNSVKEKKIFLLATNNSNKTIRLYESIDINNSTTCPAFSSSTFQGSTGYPSEQVLYSSLLAQKGTGNGFNDSASMLCFFSNGTLSTDTTGYELTYRGDSYRILIWLTGFYELHRSSSRDCPADKVVFDSNNNILANWCETSR